MTTYGYRGLDQDGNAVEGVVEGTSSHEVIHALEQQGVRVNSIDEKNPPKRLFPRKTRMSWNDLVQFHDQLFTITSGGLPLAPSLAVMAHEIKNPRLQAVFQDIKKDLDAGNSLEEALARHPKSFPPTYTALVRAGERVGNLSEVFRHLSEYSKRMLALKHNVQEILTYPIIVVVAACALVTFLMVKIVPVYAMIFKDFGGELPAPTALLVRISDFFSRNLWTLGAGFGFLVLAGIFLLPSLFRGESGGYARDWIKLRIPLAGMLFANASKARFCRTFSMLLQAQAPVLESLELAATASGNAVMARAIAEASPRVAAGTTLSEALEGTGFFDASFCWLLGNAEQRGDVPNALGVLETDYTRRVESLRTSLLFVTGPVVVICVGSALAFIIISLYLPIFSLGDVISANNR